MLVEILYSGRRLYQYNADDFINRALNPNINCNVFM